MNEQQVKAYELAKENDDLCKVCKFRYGCPGKKIYRNGPFPPCAVREPELFVDYDALDNYAHEVERSSTENVKECGESGATKTGR